MRGQLPHDLILAGAIFISAMLIILSNFFHLPDYSLVIQKINARNFLIHLISSTEEQIILQTFGGIGNRGILDTNLTYQLFGMSKENFWYYSGEKFKLRLRKIYITPVFNFVTSTNSVLVRILNRNCTYYVVLLVNATTYTYPLVAYGSCPAAVKLSPVPTGKHKLYLAINGENFYGLAETEVELNA